MILLWKSRYDYKYRVSRLVGVEDRGRVRWDEHEQKESDIVDHKLFSSEVELVEYLIEEINIIAGANYRMKRDLQKFAASTKEIIAGVI